MSVATRRRPRRTRHPYADVDLDACRCLDVGHAWRHVEAGRPVRGPLAGIPHHDYLCANCSSLLGRAETWDGEVVTRDYHWAEDFILNARMLGAHGERRRNWRAERNRRMRAGVL